MTDFFEHIDYYVAGRLTGKALEEFEAAMYADQDLRAAVENYGVAEEVMGLMIEEHVRGVIVGLEEQKEEGPNQATHTAGYKTFLIGLIITILLALLAYSYNEMRNPKTTDNSERLYAAHYTDYISSEVRGNSPISAPRLSSCNLAHKLMQAGNYTEAKNILIDVTKREDNCTHKTQWLLSLIHLKEGETLMFTQLITEIIKEPNHTYRDMAEALYRDYNLSDN